MKRKKDLFVGQKPHFKTTPIIRPPVLMTPSSIIYDANLLNNVKQSTKKVNWRKIRTIALTIVSKHLASLKHYSSSDVSKDAARSLQF